MSNPFGIPDEVFDAILVSAVGSAIKQQNNPTGMKKPNTASPKKDTTPDEGAKAAKEIGKGNLNYPDVEVRGSEEIENLAAVFNEMKHSMQTAVSVLEDKHRMEIELKEKENEAIEFESILEREKLQKLRSQINPHFLFLLSMILKITKYYGLL